MSTQINVTVGKAGLRQLDKQQRHALRLSKAESENQRKVEARATDARTAELRKELLGTDGKPLYGTPTPATLRRDEPAAFRQPGSYFIELLPPASQASSANALPDDFPFTFYTYNWSILPTAPTAAYRWYESRIKGLKPRADFGEGFNVAIPETGIAIAYDSVREQYNPTFLAYQENRLQTNSARLTALMPLGNANDVYRISSESMLYAGSFLKPRPQLKKLIIDATLEVKDFTNSATGTEGVPGNTALFALSVSAPASSPNTARPINGDRSLSLEVKSYSGIRSATLDFANGYGGGVLMPGISLPQTLSIKAELERTGKATLTVNGAAISNDPPSTAYAAATAAYFDLLTKINVFVNAQAGIERLSPLVAWPSLPPDVAFSGVRYTFE